jgi:hypothetical protein
MLLRPVLVKIHLFLGVVGGVFFVILGLTGAVIAFENAWITGRIPGSGTSNLDRKCWRSRT